MTIDAKTKAAVRAVYAAATTSYDDLQEMFPQVGRGSLCRIINDTSASELKQHEARHCPKCRSVWGAPPCTECPEKLCYAESPCESIALCIFSDEAPQFR